jgi:hypothetical protein
LEAGAAPVVIGEVAKHVRRASAAADCDLTKSERTRDVKLGGVAGV